MKIDYKYLITYLSDPTNVEDILTYYFEEDVQNLSKSERDNIADDITTAAENVGNLIEYNKYKNNL
jgi:hypothetical protein